LAQAEVFTAPEKCSQQAGAMPLRSMASVLALAIAVSGETVGEITKEGLTSCAEGYACGALVELYPDPEARKTKGAGKVLCGGMTKGAEYFISGQDQNAQDQNAQAKYNACANKTFEDDMVAKANAPMNACINAKSKLTASEKCSVFDADYQVCVKNGLNAWVDEAKAECEQNPPSFPKSKPWSQCLQECGYTPPSQPSDAEDIGYLGANAGCMFLGQKTLGKYLRGLLYQGVVKKAGSMAGSAVKNTVEGAVEGAGKEAVESSVEGAVESASEGATAEVVEGMGTVAEGAAEGTAESGGEAVLEGVLEELLPPWVELAGQGEPDKTGTASVNHTSEEAAADKMIDKASEVASEDASIAWVHEHMQENQKKHTIHEAEAAIAMVLAMVLAVAVACGIWCVSGAKARDEVRDDVRDEVGETPYTRV